MHQVIQVGDRLAHREQQLIIVEVATEQTGQQFCRSPWFATNLQRAREPRLMMRAELVNAAMQATRNGRPCEGSTSVAGGSSRSQ